MRRRESYVQPEARRRRTPRTRTAVLVVVAVGVVGITGVSSALALPEHRSASAPSGHWTLPAIDRPLPRIVIDRRVLHGREWMLRAGIRTAPPLRNDDMDAATVEDDATQEPSASPTTVAPSSTAPSASAASEPSPAEPASSAGGISRLFASDSPWNTPITRNAGTDPESGRIVDKVLDNPSLVMNLNIYSFGIPFYTATASTPRVVLAGDAAIGPVPLDPSWKPNEGADHKMNVLDPATHTVYELQGFDPGARSVYYAVKKDYLTSIADGYPRDGRAGPTGSGLTQAGGVVRLAEMASGRIDHALSFITSQPADRFRYPASHTDGKETGIGLAEGMRIQLDPTLDVDAIPGITPGERTIAKALQRYGAFCTDTGGGNNQAMGFYVEKPKAGDHDPYPAAGFTDDWAQLPHIPRDRLRVLAADATPRAE